MAREYDKDGQRKRDDAFDDQAPFVEEVPLMASDPHQYECLCREHGTEREPPCANAGAIALEGSYGPLAREVHAWSPSRD